MPLKEPGMIRKMLHALVQERHECLLPPIEEINESRSHAEFDDTPITAVDRAEDLTTGIHRRPLQLEQLRARVIEKKAELADVLYDWMRSKLTMSQTYNELVRKRLGRMNRVIKKIDERINNLT